MWFIWKSSLNLLQYWFCFMFWFFGSEARGTLVPWPGIERTSPALEGEVLTAGVPGKFPLLYQRLESFRTSLLAQLVKNPPAMQETPVQFLGQEDPLEILTWRTGDKLLWRENRLSCHVSLDVNPGWATSQLGMCGPLPHLSRTVTSSSVAWAHQHHLSTTGGSVCKSPARV